MGFLIIRAGRLKRVGEYSFRFVNPRHREKYEHMQYMSGDEEDIHSHSHSHKRSAAVSVSDDDTVFPRKRTSFSALSFGAARSKGKKSVTQFELKSGRILNIFSSGSEASKVLGLSQSNVSQCCRGGS